jgi:hypothetical protein
MGNMGKDNDSKTQKKKKMKPEMRARIGSYFTRNVRGRKKAGARTNLMDWHLPPLLNIPAAGH